MDSALNGQWMGCRTGLADPMAYRHGCIPRGDALSSIPSVSFTY